MNSVFISGIIKGDPIAVPAKVRAGEPAKPDNVIRILTIVDSKQETKEFKIHALAGELGDKLKAIPSGKRLILDGRIASEEISEVYQGVVGLKKIVALTEAMNGTDFAVGTVSGLATCTELRHTGGGTPVVNLNIKSTRTFTSKKDNTPITTTSYLNAAVWSEKAIQLSALIPMTEVEIAVTGMLVPSEYPSPKYGGALVTKIEVWGDEFSVAGLAAGEPAAARPAAPKKPAAPSRVKSSDANMEF